MPKVRVYEIAKKLNISSKQLMEKMAEFHIEVNSHMSTLEDKDAKQIMAYYTKESSHKEVPAKNEQQQRKKEAVQPQKQQKNIQAQSVQSQPKMKQENTQKKQAEHSQHTQNKKPNGHHQTQPVKKQAEVPQGSMPRKQAEAPQGAMQKKQGETKQESTVKKQAAPVNPNNSGPKHKPGNKKKRGQRKDFKDKREHRQEQPVEQDTIQVKTIKDNITIKELAEVIGVNSVDLIKILMQKGVMASINQEIDFETAVMLGENFNVIFEKEEEKDILEEIFHDDVDAEESLQERPPVVVVMGHVDHGKTSLLDTIRESRVTEKEAGGITQHIGAYTVETNGRQITFLDTPGHEAFTAMRMRGAQVTDIAILVVAADDGVMPQTIEAINHARAANVEIIVAINKIDKPGANPDRVKQELTEYNLLAEDWGGDTICVPVSAVKNEGIDTLLEMILLVSEMKELKANPDRKARGTIIEAELDKGRGPVATVLVQNGTLKVGDPVVAGSAHGRVRAMMDDKGKKVQKAGPSKPVLILGLADVPLAGDSFYAAENEKQARQASESMIAKDRLDMLKFTTQKVSLDDLFHQIQAGSVKELNIVVKADVQGSVEAIKASLEKLSNEEVRVRIIHGGVGAITESDVMLASASNAIIIGFNVRPEPVAKSFAEEQKVDMRLYRVIYNAIEDINAAMKGLLDPIFEEKVIGHAEIRQTFKASNIGTIGGSYVLDGKFTRNGQVRLVRDGIVIYEGELASLKRFKDDVKEVNAGYECGILLNKYNDIKEGDIVECFVMEEIPR